MVESLRIVLPLAFVIASGYLIVQVVMPIAEDEEWFTVANALALAGMLYGLGSFLLVVALKWILVGRYRPRAAPMWTPFVWLSEAVTNLYESLAVPNLLDASSRHAAAALGAAALRRADRPRRLHGHDRPHRVRLRADRRRGRTERLERAADAPLRGPRHEDRLRRNRGPGHDRREFHGALRHAWSAIVPCLGR